LNEKVQEAVNQQLGLQIEDFFSKEFMHQGITGEYALNTSVSMLKKQDHSESSSSKF
jgi:hypothetical protein